jgi:vancomycin permeability regulator SanA
VGSFVSKFLRIASKTAAWLVIGISLLAASYVTLSGLIDHDGKADVSVVFGTMVTPSGKPSAWLTARLNKAVELYDHGEFRSIIVSGGIGEQGFDEAQVMKAYLVAKGIPQSAIVTDSKGANTMATARNTAAIMRAHNFKSVMLISQFFHIARAKLAFQKCGVSTTLNAHADRYFLRDVYSLARDTVGYVDYLLFETCR